MNRFKNSFDEPYKCRFESILDDKIINFWCLNILNV